MIAAAMLRIRREQRKVFVDAARIPLEAEIARHIAEHFPDLAPSLWPDRVARAIHEGTDRALAHGLATTRQIATYVTLAFLLGAELDTDPMLPWARRCLASPSDDPGPRVTRLRAEAMRFLDAAEGPRNEHLDAAMSRLASLELEALLPPPGMETHGSIAETDTHGYIEARLASFHPRKLAAIGAPATRAFIAAGVEAATARGFSGARGAALYTGMRFMLGSGFETDPLLPWAQSAIETALAAGPEGRDRALHRAIVRHVRATPRGAS